MPWNASDRQVTGIDISGLDGALAGGRLVGFTTSGSPTSGTFAANDLIFALTEASFYLCTSAGSPGTWVRAGGDRLIAHAETNHASQTSTSSTYADITNLTLSNFVVSSAALVVADIAYLSATSNSATVGVAITDGSDTKKAERWFTFASGSAGAVTFSERIAAGGTYTRKARFARISGTGTANVSTTGEFYSRLYVLGV